MVLLFHKVTKKMVIPVKQYHFKKNLKLVIFLVESRVGKNFGKTRGNERRERERWNLTKQKTLAALKKCQTRKIHSILENIEDSTAEDERGMLL